MITSTLGLLLSMLASSTWQAGPQDPGGEGEAAAACTACHGERGLSATLPGGKTRSMFVDAEKLRSSVHAGMGCADCHPGLNAENHTGGEMRDGAGLATRKACVGCHGEGAGPHATVVKARPMVGCASCHGSHGIRPVKRSQTGCDGCHGEKPGRLIDGQGKRSVVATRHALSTSVHSMLGCESCHAGYTPRFHPPLGTQSKQQISRRRESSCLQCHSEAYARGRQSVHWSLHEKRDARAPGCIDCHGAHDIQSGPRERSRTAKHCRSCHTKVYDTYAGSVHGEALSRHNPDVPTCSDCHRSHDIRDPGSRKFRSHIPELCGNCHSDRKRMARYGLSPEVVTTYLDDFHGVTFQYYRKEKGPVRKIAVCTDCHGIHDIESARGKDTKAIKGRLLDRCRKCHPKAGASFPDAWVSHWIPSPDKAPVVYAINLFYKILIPLMLIGLVLQVLLHFWRYALKR